jgi:hypothetical protein
MADYVWRELYKAAIVETDDKNLPTCIQAAKAAIARRLQDIHSGDGGPHHEELQAIADALNGLRVLRTELEKRTW